jgi:hypothetical protein
MAIRLLLASLSIGFACQPSTPAPPSGETLAPFGDDAAFSVGFPPSAEAPDATTNEDTREPGSVDEAAMAPADDSLDATMSVASGDEVEDTEAGKIADAAQDGACSAPLSAGDLVIDELMIESVAGAGDDGEWLEVQSALPCAINLRGLHGECPRGANVIAFDVTNDFWVPAGGSFLVADSTVPAINHYLPGAVLSWSGRQGDVLRNEGATVSLQMNDVLIDSVTYPALKLEVGRSWAFPSDCDLSLRDDFANWQTSTASWFPAFFGSPNAPNDDVHCKALGPASTDP